MMQTCTSIRETSQRALNQASPRGSSGEEGVRDLAALVFPCNQPKYLYQANVSSG